MFNQTITVGNHAIDTKEIFSIVELRAKPILHKLKCKPDSKINIVDCTDGEPEKTMICLCSGDIYVTSLHYPNIVSQILEA